MKVLSKDASLVNEVFLEEYLVPSAWYQVLGPICEAWHICQTWHICQNGCPFSAETACGVLQDEPPGILQASWSSAADLLSTTFQRIYLIYRKRIQHRPWVPHAGGL